MYEPICQKISGSWFSLLGLISIEWNLAPYCRSGMWNKISNSHYIFSHNFLIWISKLNIPPPGPDAIRRGTENTSVLQSCVKSGEFSQNPSGINVRFSWWIPVLKWRWNRDCKLISAFTAYALILNLFLVVWEAINHDCYLAHISNPQCQFILNMPPSTNYKGNMLQLKGMDYIMCLLDWLTKRHLLFFMDWKYICVWCRGLYREKAIKDFLFNTFLRILQENIFYFIVGFIVNMSFLSSWRRHIDIMEGILYLLLSSMILKYNHPHDTEVWECRPIVE